MLASEELFLYSLRFIKHEIGGRAMPCAVTAMSSGLPDIQQSEDDDITDQYLQ